MNRKMINIGLIIVIFLIIGIIFLVNIEKINNIVKKQLAIEEDKKEKSLFSYIVYDNQQDPQVQTLINISSENGIETVEYPNGMIVYANGRKELAIDYTATKEQNYVFKIKEFDKEIKEETLYVDDEFIYNTVLSIDTIAINTGYKNLKVSKHSTLPNYKLSYKIGNNGEWTEGEKLLVQDYEYANKYANLINEDNTITISAKIENNENGNKVQINRKYEINSNITENKIEAESLLKAMEIYKFDPGTYHSTIKIADENYKLKIYSFSDSIEIGDNQSFGISEDVGTASEYAQNMIAIRVEGDLTIDSGVRLTTYGTPYGGPKGLMIYCTGTLTNNGEISMTARGAKAEGQNVYLWKNEQVGTDNNGIGGQYEYVPSVGALGGPDITYGRQTGGGGNRTVLCIWARWCRWKRNFFLRRKWRTEQVLMVNTEVLVHQLEDQEEMVVENLLDITQEEEQETQEAQGLLIGELELMERMELED